MSKSILLLAFCLCAAPFAAGEWIHPYEPAPFLRSRLDGRGDPLNEMSFLHRLSYQPMPYLLERGPLPDRTLRATAGSISSDRFYTRLEARLEIPLDEPFFAGYRFRRDEDADGPFEWNLLGLGVRSGPWRFSVWADLEQDKSLIDTHVDLKWLSKAGALVQFVWVLPDLVHNRKNETSAYDPRPYTLYLRGELPASESLTLRGFANYQNRTALREDDAGVRSENQAVSGGLGFVWTPSAGTELELSGERLEGDRRRVGLTAPGPLDQSLDRRHQMLTLELRNGSGVRPDRWAGLRFLEFSEQDDRPGDPVLDLDTRRREYTLYLGRRFPLSERLNFEPNLFAGIHDLLRLTPNDGEIRELDETGFFGKFAPRLEALLNRDSGATLSFCLMTRLDKAAFGGGHVQLHFPF